MGVVKMIGYCKYCQSHGVWVSRLEKHSDDGTLVKNGQDEPIGMCWHCEVANKVSKEELIESVKYIGGMIHYHVYLREHFNTYPDGAMYNADEIKTQLAHLKDSEINTICEVLVAGAMRIREEGTPKGKEFAAKSARYTVKKVIANPFGGNRIGETTVKWYNDNGYGKWIE